MSSILRMDTDVTRAVAYQLRRASTDMQAQVESASANFDTMEWQGPGRDVLSGDFAHWRSAIHAATNESLLFGERLQRETEEWEGVAQSLLSAAAPTGASFASRPPSAYMHVSEVPPRTYARLSELAYLDEGQIPDDLAQRGWEAYGNVHDLIGSDHKLGGYYGVVYVNRHTGEVVIAHRGTELDKSLNPFDLSGSDLDDDTALVLGRVPAQYVVSRQFADAVQTKLGQDPTMTGYTLVHTGHSLGGALADLNALTDHSPGITFENPGTLQIVRNYPDLFVANGRQRLINYQSNPNLVHDLGAPAGYTIQVVPLEGGTMSNRIFDQAMGPVVSLPRTVQHHDLSNLVDSMEVETGFPRAYFPPGAGNVDNGWHNWEEFRAGRIHGAYGAPACFKPPLLEGD